MIGMIDINPQLQSKIFDSLFLHMKAERQDSRIPRRAAPRTKLAKGEPVSKLSGGKPVSKAKAAAAKPLSGSSQWDSLAADLHRLGLNKTTADTLVSWATGQAEQSRQSPVKIRVLHPMEREFISVDAYDYLLELYRLGLIGPPQLENLIENCAFLTSLPATREQIGKMALRAFSENLEVQGLGSSH